MSTERVQADATARGLTIEVVERPRASSLKEAARLQGIEPRDIVKTLVVKRSDGTYLFDRGSVPPGLNAREVGTVRSSS